MSFFFMALIPVPQILDAGQARGRGCRERPLVPLVNDGCWLYKLYIYISEGWFQTFFIFHNICDNPSH